VPAAPRSRVLRALGRLGAGAGLLVVFAGATLSGIGLYANLPAGRRLLALGLERALASTFEGSFSIDAVDHISPTELRARGITVRDPDGRVVLAVTALSIQADFADIGRKAWLGTGIVTLRFEHARLERADVTLTPNTKSGAPTLADAFTPQPSKSAGVATASSRELKVWFPAIEVGHAYARSTLGGLPTLEAEASSAHGSVLGSAKATAVDVDRFSVVARGLGGADATGIGSVHVRAPGGVFTSFDGYFGDVQLGTVVHIDSPKLGITLDVPHAKAEDVRAVWAAYPLHSDASAHVEAQGTLHGLQTQAKFVIGDAPVEASGELRLSGTPGADLEISGRDLDLRSLWPGLPRTQIAATTKLAVFEANGVWLADLNGSTKPATIASFDVPPVDVTGTYSSLIGFDGKATVHEQGIPTKLTVTLHPDGTLEANAESKHVDLHQAPRLEPYFDGHGIADLQLKAKIVKNRLDARVTAAVRDFEYGPVHIDSSMISGRATGPLDVPNRLNVNFDVASKHLRAGALGFDELDTKVQGPITAPVISTNISSHYGPAITAKATLVTRGKPRLDRVTLEVRRDQAVLTATVGQIDLERGRLAIDGLSLQGAGGTLTASGVLTEDALSLTAHGSDLDLADIAHALGLPRGLVAGKLQFDTELESSKKTQHGKLELSLDKGQGDGVSIDTLSLSANLDGPQLALKTSAKLHDFGQFSGTVHAALNGSLTQATTFEHATGDVTITAEHVPLALLTYAIPTSAGVNEIRGEANATLELSRTAPNAIPSAALLASTSGLYIGLAPKTKGAHSLAFSDVDTHFSASVNGDTGESEVTLKLDDDHGALASGTGGLTLDLATALRDRQKFLAELRTTPLRAKVVIEDRPLEQLPAPLAPAGVSGRLRTEATLQGTWEKPIFSDKIELYQIRLGENESDKPLDVCGQLDYDKSTGQYGARAELFLPSQSTRACQGTRVAQGSAGGRAEWDRLVHPTLTADAAWTGSAGLSLEGLPLNVIPTIAESGVSGRVYGAVMFDRRQALPQISARVEVRDALVERAKVGSAVIQARTDGRSLSADVSIDDRGGKLDAHVQSSINWQGVVPGIDDTLPVSAKLTASNVDAVVLTPFLRDVLSEIGGKLDTELSATLTPDLAANATQHWTGSVTGTLGMHDGSLQLARIGLRMKNVSFRAQANTDQQNSTLIKIVSLKAAAEADRQNVAASGNIRVEDFKVVNGNAQVTVQGVPLLVEGVTLATLNGEKIGIDLERRPTEMFVGLTIPNLTAELPRAGTRELIALNTNPSIEVQQPLSEPQKPDDGESLPWRMRFGLGNRVKVVRQDLFLPISGSPEIVLGNELQVGGDIELTPGGRLNLPGLPRAFTIENGTISFDPNGDPKDPRLKVRARCEVPQLVVYATVSGTFRKASISYDSDPHVNGGDAEIIAALLNTSNDDPNSTTNTNGAGSQAAAGLSAGAGYIGSQLLANTPLSSLEIKAGSGTTADQRVYSSYSAAYPLSDTVWFEGSYKNVGAASPTDTATTAAFSGAIDWRFRRNWSLRAEGGNLGTGVELLWQYKY